MEDQADYYSDDDIDLGELLEELNEYDHKPQNCKILKEEHILRRMEEDISTISDVFCISKHEASVLLRNFNWSVSKVEDVWFSDESGTREKVGLLDKPAIRDHEDSFLVICGMCFESFSSDEISSAGCGHLYCNECWSTYISISINNDGVGCLFLRCPDPSCQIAVDRNVIDSLASEADRKKYYQYLVRSYIEFSKSRKWCPGANCDNIIEFIHGEGSFDVTCDCFASFCWNCDKEGHRPLDCETVKKWILKNGSESENANYIISYCKPCPNCRRPIEKNQGRMAMKCSACQHRFCWICLSPYGDHTSCNGYKPWDMEDKKKENAKQFIEKYVHYFERWDANLKSRAKAFEDFKKVKNEQFKQFITRVDMPEYCFDFVTKAWMQVLECRRILGWSYAYGYYLPEDEKAKKQLYECLQGEAESRLEVLHNLVEVELEQFLNNEVSSDINGYKNTVIHLTKLTGNYFERLVKALENGLLEASSNSKSHFNNSDLEYANGVYEASSSSSHFNNLDVGYANGVYEAGGSNSSSNNSDNNWDMGYEDDYWNCDRCTYANPYYSYTCQMCSDDTDDNSNELV